MKNRYRVIGIMSGTSMDGVDLACVSFAQVNRTWEFVIEHTTCVPYEDVWLNRLQFLPEQNAEIFAKTHIFYGHYIGQLVDHFIKENKITQVDLVASHGQTIFHNPKAGYTVQIGDGAALASRCGLPVVCDLRSMDMAYGGQGAPIVPLGERFLFPEYKAFLNIGGISNIARHANNKSIGYDVCMGNLLLDQMAAKAGLSYDDDGKLARSGKVNDTLLTLLNNQAFFDSPAPKTLDAGDVLKQNMSILETSCISVEDKLATLCEHIAVQIGRACEKMDTQHLYVTGGGALNGYLVERITALNPLKIVTPNNEIIVFKEALIMAFLGLKRWLGEPNVLASVTGADKDSINGAIYLP